MGLWDTLTSRKQCRVLSTSGKGQGGGRVIGYIQYNLSVHAILRAITARGQMTSRMVHPVGEHLKEQDNETFFPLIF